MKRLFTAMLPVLFLCVAPATMAETKEMRAENKHEIRIGVGEGVLDRLFIASHDMYESKNIYTAPNIFLEYQYRINHWCGVGVQLNGAWWGADLRKRFWNVTQDDWQHIVQGGLAVMPTVRFTYLHKEWVNLYSGLSLGYYWGMNTFDEKTRHSHGAVGNVCALGVSVGRNHFFGTGEIGFMCGGTYDVLQIGSRLLSLSIGYRL